jgi:hypothetical protein
MGMSESMDATFTKPETDFSPFNGDADDVFVQKSVNEIERILNEASTAHHEYERTELKGVRDKDWAEWYFGYAILHGITKYVRLFNKTSGLVEYLNNLAANPPEMTWARFAALNIVKDFGRS